MNTQLEFATEKLKWIEYACINCHPSMKPYYQGLYAAQKKHIQLLMKDIKNVLLEYDKWCETLSIEDTKLSSKELVNKFLYK